MTLKQMTITDPVYGSIGLSHLQLDLIQTVEVQRLNSIHQLGMTYQVYPSAHSMRFAHALGVSHLADRMGRKLILENPELNLDNDSKEYFHQLVIAAGLLHDVCHTPWSHTLEPLLMEVTGKDHMQMTHDLLTGAMNWPVKGSGKIPEILKKHGLNPSEVSSLIAKSFTGPDFLQQMIFGEVDADTLDYLCRDFTSTGVTFGHVDVNRLIQTMVVKENRLCFKEKGLQAVRDFLNARIEMYSAVYLHKKTRIADVMFLRAARKSVIEFGEHRDFWAKTDDEYLSLLGQSQSEYVRDIAWRLKYRQGLFKRVFQIEAGSTTDRQRNLLRSIDQSGSTSHERAFKLEKTIERKWDIPEGLVIVDLVSAATDLSESRFKDLDIVFVDDGGFPISLKQIDEAFAEYMSRAQPSRSIMSIYAPDEYRSLFVDCLPVLHDVIESHESNR